MGSIPGCFTQSCETSACLCRDVQHGYFPSNLTEKLQWMAPCFCKQFARNFAVSPDRLCIALFSNHSLIHWLSRYLLQIPALDMLWDQFRSMLHPFLCLVQNPGSSGHSTPCTAEAKIWMGTSPFSEHSGVSNHIPVTYSGSYPAASCRTGLAF